MAEELPEFDAEWFPSVWRAYIEFRPSMENPHGNGGFLSPKMEPARPSDPCPKVRLQVNSLRPPVPDVGKGLGSWLRSPK